MPLFQLKTDRRENLVTEELGESQPWVWGKASQKYPNMVTNPKTRKRPQKYPFETNRGSSIYGAVNVHSTKTALQQIIAFSSMGPLTVKK